MPDWIPPALVMQLPLVAVVVYGFVSRRVRSAGEVTDWQKLYQQERADRIAAEQRLSTATSEIRELTAGVAELTKEVLRHGGR